MKKESKSIHSFDCMTGMYFLPGCLAGPGVHQGLLIINRGDCLGHKGVASLVGINRMHCTLCCGLYWVTVLTWVTSAMFSLRR